MIIGIPLVIVILVIFIAVQPSSFRVERAATVAAPPEVVFAQINDFHNWQAWSPWAQLDPDMKLTYDGPEAGQGARYAWTGNKKAGEGRMEIIESRPAELIKINLEFIKPFAAKNLTEFTFTPAGDATKVTWAMSGDNGFMGKAFGLFMKMDKLVGGDFEKGLASIKQISEKAVKE
jgi:carbon monoxide dehydrogenase subunit G